MLRAALADLPIPPLLGGLRGWRRRLLLLLIYPLPSPRTLGPLYQVRQAHRESKRAQRKGTLEGTQGGIRVYKMWEEATEFDAHVATLQGELRKFETATLDFIDSLFPILRAPLPRVSSRLQSGALPLAALQCAAALPAAAAARQPLAHSRG